MRLMSTEALKPGLKVGQSIYNDRDKVLLREGVEITERHISRLKELNIPFIYIFDQKTEHIKPLSSIPNTLRRKAIDEIKTTFQEIQKAEENDSSLILEKASWDFKELIKQLIHEISGNKKLLHLLSDVYTYDHYIFTHSLNVTLYSIAVGIKLKLAPRQLEILALGALLHDVGKVSVPKNILLKPGRLTEEEFVEIKKHSECGFNLLRGIHTVPLVVAHCAYQHHERLDGSGYPRGLLGDQIHYFGKILAVADVFDAVTSNRIYRGAMLPHEGLEVLYAGSGTQFDRTIVEAFRSAVAIYPNSLTVELSDGSKGIVCRQNNGLSDRPVVEVFEQNSRQLDHPYEVDLSRDLDILITGCDTAFFCSNQKVETP
ncbi:putative nucleotidyltransferase with HDIG domain [Peribacillus deserti]|uniref:Nucleotidyltransferase with HDIG domain n=1 Tax=Peribacillus deserti TaxID=673318 RepID=A0ABS2QQJ1_9BACI|nr:HD-GYP domain-containing protein [Peribacillus deserti]MBM7694718.1 putative nucleotidyltransferase with HDIG domain [Peribacillus deserti]